MNTNTMVNREIAKKVLEVVDAGLVSGLGEAIPGRMCVEAAVCYAMGLPHSDEPTCVGSAVRIFKINLNDSNWPTDADRTKGMRKLAIAQLGSDSIDQMAFAKHVALECQRRVLPLVLRRAASFKGKFAEQLEAAAVACEASTTHEEAAAATMAAREVARASHANANAYDYAKANAYANAYDYAYAYAYANANDYAKANAYANAYDYDYANANAEFRLQLLHLVAQIGLEALIACKSPGCEWLDLCE
jgi:hypothetical protein